MGHFRDTHLKLDNLSAKINIPKGKLTRIQFYQKMIYWANNQKLKPIHLANT